MELMRKQLTGSTVVSARCNRGSICGDFLSALHGKLDFVSVVRSVSGLRSSIADI